MKENQSVSAHTPVSQRVTGYRAMGEIPIGDIQGWIAKHGQCRQKAGREVTPLLVREETVWEIDTAACLGSPAPPLDELKRFVAVPRCGKPEIEHPGAQE